VKRSPPDSYATVTPQKPTASQIDELQSLDRQIGEDLAFLLGEIFYKSKGI
jgi:hypothetical protein